MKATDNRQQPFNTVHWAATRCHWCWKRLATCRLSRLYGRRTMPPSAPVRSPLNIFRNRDQASQSSMSTCAWMSLHSVDSASWYSQANTHPKCDLVPLSASPAKDRRAKLVFSLPPEDITLTLVARDSDAVSKPACLHLRWDGVRAAEMRLPRLRGLFVGESDYELERLKLPLAAKDAIDLASAFKAQQGKAYSKVDAQVSRTLVVPPYSKGSSGWKRARRRGMSICCSWLATGSRTGRTTFTSRHRQQPRATARNGSGR